MSGYLGNVMQSADQHLSLTSAEHVALKQGTFHVSSFLWSFGLGIFLLVFLSRKVALWNRMGPVIFDTLPQGVLFAVGLLIVAIVAARLRRETIAVEPYGFVLALLFQLSTDWITRPYSFFPGESFRGEILVCAFFFLVFLSRSGSVGFRIVVLLAPVLLSYAFLQKSQGHLIFSDDHPAVLYRLILLRDHFPAIPIYNSLWNAGLDARDFFSTGILNLFFLTWPILELFEIREIYNYLVLGVVFFLTPCLSFLATRRARLESPAPEIAALLSITSSLLWYRWCFKYGSMGFVTSLAFVPLSLVMIARMLDRDYKFSWRDSVLSIFSISMLVFWPPAGLVLVPAICLLLFFLLRVIRRRSVFVTLVLLVLVNLPWMLVFISVARVGTFLSASVEEGAAMSAQARIQETRTELRNRIVPDTKIESGIEGSVLRIRENATKINPLLIFLAVPGLLGIASRSLRHVIGGSALWFVFLGTVMPPYFPQLDLERAFLMLGHLLCLPVAGVLSKLTLNDSSNNFAIPRWRWLQRSVGVLVAGILFSGIFAGTWIMHDRSLESYSFANTRVDHMVKAIKEFGGDGRVLYSGFVLHELNGGHLAPLVHFTRRPLVASSPVHNSWRRMDIVPTEVFNGGDQSIEQFFDLLNITAVFVHEERWLKYFERQTAIYQLVWQEGRFYLYQRKIEKGGYFQEGAGEVLEQETNFIRLRLTTPTAVIKFRYYPFLVSSNCELQPAFYPGDLALIRLENCQTSEDIVIRARTGFWRVFNR